MTDSHGTAPQAEPFAADTSSNPSRPPLAPDFAPAPAFDPVPVRARVDGWTPEKQRDYVEALADCGVSREAAARVGMTEQSASRLRRRADARGFDLACEAAVHLGSRRLRSVAYERAIEGTIKQHFYHGELKGEERVYDNRLLTYLLGKTDHALVPAALVRGVVDHWETWMDAIAAGLQAPRPADLVGPSEDPRDGEEESVWIEDGVWWTSFPPPDGFEGEEQGEYDGEQYYCRTLTAAERAAVEPDVEGARRSAAARRDRYFGFAQ